MEVEVNHTTKVLRGGEKIVKGTIPIPGSSKKNRVYRVIAEKQGVRRQHLPRGGRGMNQIL